MSAVPRGIRRESGTKSDAHCSAQSSVKPRGVVQTSLALEIEFGRSSG